MTICVGIITFWKLVIRIHSLTIPRGPWHSPLTLAPQTEAAHCLSLAKIVNAPLKCEGGRGGGVRGCQLIGAYINDVLKSFKKNKD